MNISTKLDRAIKLLLVAGWAVCGLLTLNLTSFSSTNEPNEAGKLYLAAAAQASGYAGSETCKDCHESQFVAFSKTAHGKLSKAGWAEEKQGCESCHGPGKAHAEAGGDKSLIKSVESLSPKQASETCLKCHAGKEDHNNYRRGAHWRNDVGCNDCHSPHGENTSPVKMLVRDEPKLCMECHTETRSHFQMPFRHRVLEGFIDCSDCHNPHGGFEQKQTRLTAGADATCLKCHGDKRGPFVYEHAPIKVEGCAICHTPHGSTNPKLLKRNEVAQLCLECHSNTGEIGAPNTPSFHNLATPRFQNCTICHVKIHGSNTHPFFFR